MVDTPTSIKKFQFRHLNTNTIRQLDVGWARIALLSAAPYSIHEASDHAVWGLSFARQRGVHSVGSSGRRQDFDAWPGELAITEPGVSIFSESEHGGEYLTVHLQRTAPKLGIDLAVEGKWAAPRSVFPGDREALRLGWQLRKLLLATSPQTELVEGHTALLVAHGQSRLRSTSQGPRDKPRNRYATDRQALAKVLQHIQDALDAPLPLLELAQTANMEPLRFLRSFTRALGCTPHAYVLEARLQKARELMRNTDDSLAAIAIDCGFAHQSHLGAALKQRLGTTPLACRQLDVLPGVSG